MNLLLELTAAGGDVSFIEVLSTPADRYVGNLEFLLVCLDLRSFVCYIHPSVYSPPVQKSPQDKSKRMHDCVLDMG